MSDPPLRSPTVTYPSIPEPGNDIASLRETITRLKEAVELLTGQRGTAEVIEQTSVQGILREFRAQGSRVYDLIEAGPGLARRVEGVETQVDDVSASGQVVISAEANPTGYKAYFGVYLRASADSTPGTERRAGMHLGLTNADGGVFALDVDKFILRDNSSGDLSSVFTYSGGLFTMTGNVTVNGSFVVNGTITSTKIGTSAVETAKVNLNAVGQFYQSSGSTGPHANAGTSSWQTLASVTIVGVSGGFVQFYADVGVRTTYSIATSADVGDITGEIRIIRNGSTTMKTIAVVFGQASEYDYYVIAGFHSDGASNHTYDLQVRFTGGTAVGHTWEVTSPEFSVAVHKR